MLSTEDVKSLVKSCWGMCVYGGHPMMRHMTIMNKDTVSKTAQPNPVSDEWAAAQGSWLKPL